MPTGFNTIPGSGLTAPIFAFEVNSGGAYDSVSRLVLIGHKTAAGTLAANAVSVCASQQEADALAGPGSMLREMFRIARQNAPAQEIWLGHVAEAGAAATWTITVGAVPSAGGVGYLDICGERLAVQVAAGDAPATVAASIATVVNGYYNALTQAMLPVTAASTGNVATLTARHGGAVMNDVEIVAPTDSPNLFAQGSWIVIAAGTAGAGVPTLTSALAALGDDPADLVVSPWSDAASIAAYAAWSNDVSGRWAWSRQSYGHVLTVNTGALAAQTTLGLSLNDRHLTIVPRVATQPTPCWLMAAGVAARVLPWLSDCVLGNVARNQTGLVVQGVKGPRDRSLVPGYAARNTLVNAGVSSWKLGADGSFQIDKLVTTYRTGASGQPDTVFRDIQALFQISGGLGYMRAQVAQAHGQKALASANPRALLAITTPVDIRNTLIGAYVELCKRGVFENPAWFAANVSAVQNAQNANRVDCYVPLDRVNPLDIFAANATVFAQAPLAV